MTDYISREAALAVFGDVHPLDYNAQAYMHGIETLPVADVRENKKGKWKPYNKSYICSACGSPVSFWKSRFCPCCGADMREEEHETV